MITTIDHGNYRGTSYPRSIVRLDGNDIMFNSWTVNLNSTHIADDFELVMPFRVAENMSGQSYLNNTPEYTSYLYTNDNVLVEIFIGYTDNSGNFTTDDLTRIMYGYMDEVNATFSSSGETVTLKGRNMVAPFLDNKTTDKYQNMTSSAIAQMLATSHGLQTSITPTYTLAGTYYNGDNVQLTSDDTEWDLLTFLAEQEGFTLRVMDNTLYFGPFDVVVGNAANTPLNYTWGQNIMTLTLDKQPHAAKTINVEVHSYYNGQHIKAKADKLYAKAQSTYTERYYFAGLTQDQAQKKAQSILDELSQLEVTGTVQVSGNEQLTVDRQIMLYGVGAGLSTSYYIRQATHSFDQTNGGGYTANVTFSNLLLPDENAGSL